MMPTLHAWTIHSNLLLKELRQMLSKMSGQTGHFDKLSAGKI